MNGGNYKNYDLTNEEIAQAELEDEQRWKEMEMQWQREEEEIPYLKNVGVETKPVEKIGKIRI